MADDGHSAKTHTSRKAKIAFRKAIQPARRKHARISGTALQGKPLFKQNRRRPELQRSAYLQSFQTKLQRIDCELSDKT